MFFYRFFFCVAFVLIFLPNSNIDAINAAAPAGSYVTVEWPVNFGGVNSQYYTRGEHDYLYDKAVELMDKFYYLSHTFNHPCTFDTLSESDGYTLMTSEVFSISF